MNKVNKASDVAGKYGVFNLNNSYLQVLNNDQTDYTIYTGPVWTGSLDTAMVFDTEEEANAYLKLNSMFVGYGFITGQMVVQLHTTSDTPQAYGNNLKVLVTKPDWFDTYLHKPIRIISSLNLSTYTDPYPYPDIFRPGVVLDFLIHR